MVLERIVIATDESEAGRQAVRVGRELARTTSASVSVMRVVFRTPPATAGARATGPSHWAPEQSEHERLRNWLESEPATSGLPSEVQVGIAAGVPSIEISRYAENYRADLLVLGRKARSQAARLLVGDTADAVARRSLVPCLFVPPGVGPIRRVLVALDGSERGLRVLQQTAGFARAIGAPLQIVTVEPVVPGENGVGPVLTRSQRLGANAQQVVRRELGEQACVPVDIRRGETVEQVLAAVGDHSSEVLAIGFHRGGPPGMLEAGSTARRLAHLATCAVLTIPL